MDRKLNKLLDSVGATFTDSRNKDEFILIGVTRKTVILKNEEKTIYPSHEKFSKFFTPLLKDGMYIATRLIPVKGQNHFLVFSKNGVFYTMSMIGKFIPFKKDFEFTFSQTSVENILENYIR